MNDGDAALGIDLANDYCSQCNERVGYEDIFRILVPGKCVRSRKATVAIYACKDCESDILQTHELINLSECNDWNLVCFFDKHQPATIIPLTLARLWNLKDVVFLHKAYAIFVQNMRKPKIVRVIRDFDTDFNFSTLSYDLFKTSCRDCCINYDGANLQQCAFVYELDMDDDPSQSDIRIACQALVEEYFKWYGQDFDTNELYSPSDTSNPFCCTFNEKDVNDMMQRPILLKNILLGNASTTEAGVTAPAAFSLLPLLPNVLVSIILEYDRSYSDNKNDPDVETNTESKEELVRLMQTLASLEQKQNKIRAVAASKFKNFQRNKTLDPMSIAYWAKVTKQDLLN